MYAKTKKAIKKQADSVVPDKWQEISDAVESLTVNSVSQSRKHYNIKRIVALAACFCIVLGAVLFYKSYKKPSIPLDTENSVVISTTKPIDKEIEKRTVITENTSETSGYVKATDMKAPDPGEKIYSMGLRNALEEHKGEDVYYLLNISMHKKDGNQSRLATEEEEKAEYQRLASLGYEFYKDETWTYVDEEGNKEHFSVVVGCYTEADLSDFDINPEYGYFFDFERNGDGSPIPFDECEKIVVKEGKWGRIV